MTTSRMSAVAIALSVAALIHAVLVIDRSHAARVQSDSGQAPLAGSLRPVIVAAFAKQFDVKLVTAAFHDDPTNGGCRSPRHVTATAYIDRGGKYVTLLRMNLSPDGGEILKHERRRVLAPSGIFKVLTVLIQYPETIDASAPKLWEASQRQINAQHREFARSHGLTEPLVAFENTNVMVPPDPGLLTPRNPPSVRAAAARAGQPAEGYDVVIAIDINPSESVGGYALEDERAIYVGNYAKWKRPLAAADWAKVAATAYHHEMAHHWGWDHDWAASCGATKRSYDPFIAPPVLFGWEDLDGDGTVEILDATPYGLTAPAPDPR